MLTCAYPPRKPTYTRAVALPSSNFSNLPEPAKTFHIALLARAAAIFRVEELAVYVHESYPCDAIKDVVEALETPQYLRRKIIPKKPSLKYIGLVPPLAIPSHQLKNDDLIYREGVILAKKEGRVLVDIGLDKPVLAVGEGKIGSRVTVKRVGDAWFLASSSEVEVYWGFKVNCFQGMQPLVEHYKRRNFMIIATSRRGRTVDLAFLKALTSEVEEREAKGVLLLFGSWKKGVYEIGKEENVNVDELADFVLNTIPCQGTRTVRTEEAVLATLSLLNLVLD